jgi:hypothetical protein
MIVNERPRTKVGIRRVRLAFATLAAASLVGSALVSSAPAGAVGASLHSNYTIPGHARFEFTEAWCDNTGPHITISSELDILGDHSAQLTFKNNAKGTKSLSIVGEVVVDVFDTDGTELAQIAKQPPMGGVGGNPFIYFHPEGSENYYYLGRCVQDGKIRKALNTGPFAEDLDVSAFTNLFIQSLECTSKGSKLSVTSDSGTDDINGWLVFTNSDLGRNPQHINDDEIAASVGMTLLQGLSNIRKGWGVGGAGGNPLIEVATGTGADVNSFKEDGPGLQLGRCKNLL